ncbi:hypothetical protein GCM10009681_56720 [Luedemannella helvata]|uniref:Uncharacterized protein n=1 Tax=Luedemannella helvata TaxID=349315 RepID=A0ABP4XHF2_9ACTN
MVLFLLALGSAVAGFVAIRYSVTSSGVSYEIGKWLLQLTTVFTGAGFITAVFRQVEITRAKRDAWMTTLQDLVVGQDALEGACMRLISNSNAETYADMIEKCRELRAMLRRIIALPEAYDRSGDMRRHVQRMRQYLKPLIHEYERHYMHIQRQGRLDEKALEARLDELVKINQPVLTEDLLKWTSVGELLRDARQFPSLAACLQDFDEGEIQFMEDSELDSAYESVKRILQKNAGVESRTPSPSVTK